MINAVKGSLWLLLCDFHRKNLSFISGTAEPERNWEIISSKFLIFPPRRSNPVIMGKNLYRITQWGPEVEPIFLWHSSRFFLPPKLPLGSHSLLFTFFFPFESVFCTHESRVLTYLLSHHQYSYPCRWHLSRKGILPSGFMKKSVSSGKPQGCKAWASPPIINNTEAPLHGFVITLASVLSLFLFFNFNILKFKFLFIY